MSGFSGWNGDVILMDDGILKAIINPKSGDYYCEKTDQFICIAMEDTPRVIGAYSRSACLVDSGFQSFASKQIWKEYFKKNI